MWSGTARLSIPAVTRCGSPDTSVLHSSAGIATKKGQQVYQFVPEEQQAITRASEGWELVFLSSGICHLYGKEHSPAVLELV